MDNFLISSFAILISFIGYYIYIKSILSGKTKPHAFSWFVWGVLIAIVFAAQLNENAGFGAWVSGISMLFCFIVSVLALKYNKLRFPLIDVFCLVAAFVAIGLWFYFKDPTWSVIIITLADLISWIPTVRHAYSKPQEENYRFFIIGSLKFFISLFALSTFTISSALYPIYLVLTNSLFALIVIIRRKQLKKTLSD